MNKYTTVLVLLVLGGVSIGTISCETSDFILDYDFDYPPGLQVGVIAQSFTGEGVDRIEFIMAHASPDTEILVFGNDKMVIEVDWKMVFLDTELARVVISLPPRSILTGESFTIKVNPNDSNAFSIERTLPDYLELTMDLR